MSISKVSSIREIIEGVIVKFVIFSFVVWVASLIVVFFNRKLFLSFLLAFFCIFSITILLIALWKLMTIIEEKKEKKK